MIQPTTAQEARYAHNLAALLVRAFDQSRADDEPNSKRLMAAYRTLRAKGDESYRERNGGLVEFAHTLAFEEPRSPRLERFMAAQDERLGEVQSVATALRSALPPEVRIEIDELAVVADDDVPTEEPQPKFIDLGVPLSPMWSSLWEPESEPEPTTTPKPKRVRKPRAKRED